MGNLCLFAALQAPRQPVGRRLCSICMSNPIIWTTAPRRRATFDIYMEAIRWDNAAKLYEQYGREAKKRRRL